MFPTNPRFRNSSSGFPAGQWQPGLAVACLVVCLMAQVSPADEGPSAIQPDKLRVHVEYLASPACGGRNGQGKLECRRYIVDWYRKHDLQPLFDGSYLQTIPGRSDDATEAPVMGRNVGAFVPGTDPVLKDEWIVVNAHYDHLGTRQGRTYPGADDNASGVAMLLEVARRIARSPRRRSVAFVAFDLEEAMLWGSRWFISHPPVDPGQMKLCVTADMIGRSLGGLDLPTVFVMGAERSPVLREALRTTPVPDGLEVAHLGTDMVGTRSDYGPFRDRQIPFLFFSTGEHPDYHQPTDTADRVNYPKATRISNLICSLVSVIADNDTAPTWSAQEPEKLAEADSIFRVTGRLLDAEQKGQVVLTDVQRFFVSQVHTKTRYMVEQNSVSDEERQWLVRATQLLLLSVF